MYLIWLVAIILILSGVLGVVYFKAHSDVLKEEFQTQIDCPETLSKIEAYIDQKKKSELRQGLMHCYCLRETKRDFTRIDEVLNQSFTDIDASDDTKYCFEWAINYGSQQLMIIGTSLIVVLINALICFIFEIIS